MSDTATDPAEAAEQEGAPAIPRHEPDAIERIREAAARDAAKGEAEDDENGNGDTDEPAGEGEGEGEADTPSGRVEQAAAAKGVKLPPRTPLTKTCPRCEGWGVVRTGSQVEEHLDVRCDVCDGTGYVEKRRDPDEGDEFPGWQKPTPEVRY